MHFGSLDKSKKGNNSNYVIAFYDIKNSFSKLVFIKVN